jgi:hypothetical protein
VGKLALAVALNANHHRLQHASLTPVDGHHGAAGRGGEKYARIFFILE